MMNPLLLIIGILGSKLETSEQVSHCSLVFVEYFGFSGREKGAVNGKPEAGRVGTGMNHTVLLMCWNKDVISRSEDRGLAILKFEGGFPLEKDDPFIAVLVIPAAPGRCLARGDDPLNFDTRVGNQVVKLLVLGQGIRQVEQIGHGLGRLVRKGLGTRS
jgi:hypothetical protein